MAVYTQLSTMQKARAADQLRRTALFGCMSSDVIEDIVSNITLTTLTEGEVFFRQEQPARHLFLLSVGHLKLFRTAGNGSEKVIALVEAGSTFAEAVVFSHRKQYPVTASALADSSVWSIDAKHYLELLQNSNEACFAILGCITGRLFEQVAEVERLTLHTATSRFVSYLLEKADSGVTGAAGRVVVRLEAPKSIIASRLSIVPATFSRSLAKLSRDGLLEVHDSEIHLLDVRALHEYTSDVVV